VARKIVEEHEGSIAVRSVPREGTTFTVVLPVTSADPSQTHGARE
jgi:signal transduction histidine kinase